MYNLCWRYTFSSIESQIRVLGDYAFMLRDYELALSNYRLISTDYKLDKAWKHYAGVQVLLFLFPPLDRSCVYCFIWAMCWIALVENTTIPSLPHLPTFPCTFRGFLLNCLLFVDYLVWWCMVDDLKVLNQLSF